MKRYFDFIKEEFLAEVFIIPVYTEGFTAFERNIFYEKNIIKLPLADWSAQGMPTICVANAVEFCASIALMVTFEKPALLNDSLIVYKIFWFEIELTM